MNIEWQSILNIILGRITIWQFVDSKKEQESTKSKVRSWQNQAEGIKNALLSIAQNPQDFTDKNDVTKSVQAVTQSAVALDNALIQERFYSDEEVISKKEESAKEMKELLGRIQRK